MTAIDVGRLAAKLSAVGSVPPLVDVGGVEDILAPAIENPQLEIANPNTYHTELPVALALGSEDIGKPYRTYLGVEPNGGVGAAVIAVAGVERDGDSVRQWMVELATGAFAI